MQDFTLPMRPKLIAEIGINHNGSMEIAKKMIDLAIALKWDSIKFQKRTLDVVYKESFLSSPRSSPWGSTQRDQKQALEFSKIDYDEIDQYCRANHIEWSASAWDIPSLEFLDNYQLPFHKIASAMTTNLEFVAEVATRQKLTYMSTGMTNFEDLDAAVEKFLSISNDLVLMHTVSTYPAAEEDLNLLCINTLKERYDLPVGYSGHESTVSPSIVAASLGAVAIERHITLDRSMYGSDQSASLEFGGMQQLSNVIHKFDDILGDGLKRITSKEMEIARKLRYWREE